MVVVVAPEHVDAVMTQLMLDETVYRIGRIERRAAGQASTVVV
jgi:phosphoribosylaminoimidazole (AIR) synthetase